MSTRLLLRTRLPRHALGASIVGLSLGTSLTTFKQSKLRLDARETPRPINSLPPVKERLDPELLKQLSGGSITGFVSGVLISIFSRTLVLLLGISVVIAQVASRYGLDLVQQLKLKQRLGNSRVLAALERDPAFKLSFGLFFAMSAFMQF
ncbi:uncharacterized protein GGS22DRAFT_31158 [Annulohypoxylon maeteangense]|uniref:uncharacterized protein n=1 Tax=Annulohypoxylon maeteangense TaxID=1927788 RepID=UPI00200880C1|nr:uncharacterized protein GGS22DRAFT_31158 [Annulohypoxylon maeteangense]KAI0883467.1 hypothetical protein GGS22DRAFT_31158 [Annulohypoxylon maeteangense]